MFLFYLLIILKFVLRSPEQTAALCCEQASQRSHTETWNPRTSWWRGTRAVPSQTWGWLWSTTPCSTPSTSRRTHGWGRGGAGRQHNELPRRLPGSWRGGVVPCSGCSMVQWAQAGGTGHRRPLGTLLGQPRTSFPVLRWLEVAMASLFPVCVSVTWQRSRNHLCELALANWPVCPLKVHGSWDPWWCDEHKHLRVLQACRHLLSWASLLGDSTKVLCWRWAVCPFYSAVQTACILNKPNTIKGTMFLAPYSQLPS